MNKQKLEIKQLEQRVMMDKALLQNQKAILNKRLYHLKSAYLAIEIIAGGFTLGFLIGIRKKAFKKLSNGIWAFLRSLAWLKHTNRLMKAVIL